MHSPTDIWSDFDTFGSSGLVKMLSESQKFTTDLRTPLMQPRWISLLGPCGIGKTMLGEKIYAGAKAFCKEHPRLENGRRERRVQRGMWPKMANALRDGEYELLGQFASAWMVFIDDIGAEYCSKSTFITSKLFDLCTERVGKWTVLTSNLSLEDIATRLDARIASRMLRGGSVVVEVDVQDYNTR